MATRVSYGWCSISPARRRTARSRSLGRTRSRRRPSWRWRSLPNTAPYGTNAYAYGGLARECVVLGPGSIEQAHGVEEWVELAELEKLARIYAHWWEV